MEFSVDDDLKLKLLALEDAEELFALVDGNRAHLRRWLPWVDANASVEDSRAFIRNAMHQHAENRGFQAGMVYRDTLVGIIGYHPIDWLNRNVEIGYWIGEGFQGKGIVTQCCRYLIDYAFNSYRLQRVQIRCAIGNDKSCAIIERLGLTYEGIARSAEFLYDHYVDLRVYGITAGEWRTRHI